MPRQVSMTWIPGQKRWTRMYRGKRYYVSARELNCPPTLADSLAAANDWWQKKLVEIEGTHVKPGSGQAIEVIARSYATNALDSSLHLKATIEQLLDDLHANGQVELTGNDGEKYLATKDQVIDALLGESRAAQIREAPNPSPLGARRPYHRPASRFLGEHGTAAGHYL